MSMGDMGTVPERKPLAFFQEACYDKARGLLEGRDVGVFEGRFVANQAAYYLTAAERLGQPNIIGGCVDSSAAFTHLACPAGENLLSSPSSDEVLLLADTLAESKGQSVLVLKAGDLKGVMGLQRYLETAEIEAIWLLQNSDRLNEDGATESHLVGLLPSGEYGVYYSVDTNAKSVSSIFSSISHHELADKMYGQTEDFNENGAMLFFVRDI